MTETLHVLLVEDNPADVDLIREMLPEKGPIVFEVTSVPRLSEAIARLATGGFALALIDLGLPDSQGLGTFEKLRQAAPDLAMIVLTGNDDQETAVAAVREGAQDYLVKGEVIGNLLVRATRYAIERKKAEGRERLAHKVLDLLNRPDATTETIGDILRLVKASMDFEAVAIRLQEGDDFPYYVANGFSERFLRAEGRLCERNDAGEIVRDAAGSPALECMCGNVLCGRTDPTLPFFTAGGSFWTNNTTQLLATTAEADRQARTRNRCNGEGYESVALIPLRSGDEIIGLLQLNDQRPDRFTPETIRFFEGLSASIAIALARKRANQALRESENKFRAMAESIPLAIYLSAGIEQISEYLNPAFTRLFGYTLEDVPTIEQWWLLAYPDEGYRREISSEWTRRIEHAIETQSPIEPMEVVVTCKDGSTKNISWGYITLGDKNYAFGLDLTEYKRAEQERETLEEQFRQAQKMDAIGQLAGGVAHDFNNILQAMVGYSSLLLDHLPEHDATREYAEEIAKSADRAALLTRQLLTFSRRQVLEMEDLDLNDVVQLLLKMIVRIIGEDIAIEVLQGRRLGLVHADRGQMEQVLLNICVNARDAMPGGGSVTIETENLAMDKAYCDAHAWASPGRYVLLSVTDTGCGMDAATQARIFEPFFTTKVVGKGTGLGLATVYGIVRQHQGMIQVYSEVGKGTTFKVYLPSIERTASTVGTKIVPRATGGTETILVAEDDEMLRKLAARILETVGYTVLLAADGQEALDMFEKQAANVDLLLLDVVMPRMGGKAVYNLLHPRRPRLRFLFSSGYSSNAIHTGFVLQEGIELIQKPYAPDALLRKVRQVLDAVDPIAEPDQS